MTAMVGQMNPFFGWVRMWESTVEVSEEPDADDVMERRREVLLEALHCDPHACGTEAGAMAVLASDAGRDDGTRDQSANPAGLWLFGQSIPAR